MPSGLDYVWQRDWQSATHKRWLQRAARATGPLMRLPGVPDVGAQC